MVSAMSLKSSGRSGFKPWLGLLRCVFGQDTYSSSGCMNGYRRTANCEVALRRTSIHVPSK